LLDIFIYFQKPHKNQYFITCPHCNFLYKGRGKIILKNHFNSLDTIFLSCHACSCYVLFTDGGFLLDWARAIERNSEALKGIVATLIAMLGLDGTDAMVRLPHSLHRAVLRVLQPAESALRRLIVIVARELVVKLATTRAFPARPIIGKGLPSRPSFKLFDPRKSFALSHGATPPRFLPRIHVFGGDPRVAALWSAPPPLAAPVPSPDGLVSAEPLTRRLEALKLALNDLPRQARRLARWRLRRENIPSLKFKSPLRPGPPPGHRRKKVHEVDEVLAECHGLARDALRPDTS
jgi:hypothetical protein